MIIIAKCGCAGTTCACRITGSGSVLITGTGTAQDPYVASLGSLTIATLLTISDSTSINLTLLGSGTALDPYVLSGVVTPGATVTVTPVTGGTTTIDSGTRTEVLSPAGTIATHTLTLPLTSNALEQEIKILATATITALTVNGAVGTTVAGAPTTLAANAYFRMQLIGTVWRRIG